MSPERRCFVGISVAAAIGALTASAILLPEQPSLVGACFLAGGAANLLNVVLLRVGASPLIPNHRSVRQSAWFAGAGALLGAALLYKPLLPGAAVISLGAGGVVAVVRAFTITAALGRTVRNTANGVAHQ
jgi:uncharacterized membrane protein